jgi:microcin C transport system substrate-binding protein
MPPVTEINPDSGETLRDHLRQAKALLAAAGWTYRDGALRNAKGEPFKLEFLDNSGAMGRVVTPFAKNLEKLGFEVNYKVIDFAVLQKRLDVFDFEIISHRTVGSDSPGTELFERFGSKSAHTEGSANFMGLSDPAVDALLDKVVSAKTRPQLITAVRALDRVLRHGHYSIPHWYGGVHRVAWRSGKFEQPVNAPKFYQPENWAVSPWCIGCCQKSGALRHGCLYFQTLVVDGAHFVWGAVDDFCGDSICARWTGGANGVAIARA